MEKNRKTGNFRQLSEKTYEKYYKAVLKNYVRKTKRKNRKKSRKQGKTVKIRKEGITKEIIQLNNCTVINLIVDLTA